MKKTFVSIFSFTFAAIAFTVSAFAQEDGFVSIFNGKDLTGWTGEERIWSVEDGAIVGRADDAEHKLEYNTSLAYEEELADFILRYDYRITKGGNSGMYYRGWYLDPENHIYQMGGYQADFDGNATYSGIMYGEAFGGILANLGMVSVIDKGRSVDEIGSMRTAEDVRSSVKMEDWNHYEVIAKGFVFIHKINGQVTSICIDNDVDARRASGLIGIQAHAGLGTPMKVEVKNIYLKKL